MVKLLHRTTMGSLIAGLRDRIRPPGRMSHRPRGRIPKLDAVPIANAEQFERYLGDFRDEFSSRHDRMARMNRPVDRVETDGFCVCCDRESRFWTPGSGANHGASTIPVPNWREGLICPGCGLNSRMRSAVHFILGQPTINRRSRIYLTEQTTPLFRMIKRLYPQTVGSEYLRDGTPRGQVNARELRHEDLTRLTFADSSFEGLVCLEVLEHVPDFRRALAECVRVLAPGGWMLLGVPFHRGPRHLERARIDSQGRVEHLLPPEYHGDPLDPEGCLCFHHFGWDLLEFLREAGFREAIGYSIWSPELGYMASEGDIHLFSARK